MMFEVKIKINELTKIGYDLTIGNEDNLECVIFEGKWFYKSKVIENLPAPGLITTVISNGGDNISKGVLRFRVEDKSLVVENVSLLEKHYRTLVWMLNGFTDMVTITLSLECDSEANKVELVGSSPWEIKSINIKSH